MLAKFFNIIILANFIFILGAGQASASTINLSSPRVLGSLDLDTQQLKSIKKAMRDAMNAPVDAEFQCGAVRLDCVVRTVREWNYKGNTYREIVVNIHTVGHASVTAEKAKGKWPAIKIK